MGGFDLLMPGGGLIITPLPARGVSLSVEIDDGGDGVLNAAEQSSVSISGSVSDGGISSSSSLTLSGLVAIGISSDGGGDIFSTSATVNNDGSFSLSDLDLSSLNDGTLTIFAELILLDGGFFIIENLSDSTVKDTTAPSISVALNDGGDNILNAAEQSAVAINGSTSGVEDGQTVSISISSDGGDIFSTSATVNDGNFSLSNLDLSSLNDGALTVKADVSDVAGNPATQATDSTTKDTSAPTISVALNDGGDNILNAAEQSAVAINGSTSGVEDGQTVSITISSDGGDIFSTSATVNNDGSFSLSDLDLSSLNDGTLTVKADVSDVAGNPATQATTSTAKDTTAPTISVALIDGGDSILNAAEQSDVTINGSTSGVEDGQTVSISISSDGGGTPVSTSAAVNNDGSFSLSNLDLSSLNDGALTVKADVSDVAGNPATQATDSTTKDTSAPTISVALIDGGDSILNAAEQSTVTINGSTSGVENGQTVAISISSDGGGDIFSTSATVNNDGSFSLSDLDLSSLNDGALTVKADVSDVAGNPATQATTSTAKDTTAPTISVALIDGGDSILNAAEQSTVTINGSTSGVENGQTVAISISSDGGGDIFSTSATVNNDGSFSLSDLDLSSLNDGTLTVKADVSDVAGNPATQATDSTTKDTSAPTISVALNDGGDNILNAAEQSAVAINGSTSGVEDGQTVSITISSDGGDIFSTSATVNNDGSFSLSDLDLSSLNDGTLTVKADVSDVAGNPATQATTSTAKDTTAPTISVALIDGGDSILNAAEQSDVTINGSTSGVEDGQTVSISISSDGGGTPVSTSAAVNNDGSFSLSNLDLSSLNDGALTVKADVSDVAGNPATQATDSTTKDTSAPTISVALIDGGDSILNAAEQSTVTINGSTSGVENGQTVAISISSDGGGDIFSTSATVNNDGSFSLSDLDLSSLNDGALTVKADVSDVAGNPATQATTSTAKDTTAPTISVALIDGGDSILNAAEQSTVTINGSTSGVENGQTVAISISSDGGGDIFSTSATVNNDGSFSLSDLDLSSLNDGTLTVKADVSDVAGNPATQATTSTAKDTTAPTISVALIDGGDSILNAAEQSTVTINGSTSGVENGQTVAISISSDGGGDIFSTSATVNNDGSFSLSDLDLSSLNDGTLTVKADVSDVAGNPATQATTSTTKDATAPSVTRVDSTTPDGLCRIGDVIDITVAFDEIVFVTGTPALQLETGTIDGKAIFTSGSGTNTLTFQYIVQDGDSSADLAQLSSTALELSGGTIKDAAGNNAILNLPNPGAAGSLSSNADLVIDGIKPTVSTDTRTYVLEASNPFGISDVGLSAKPTFADIDGDDDLDLFIANRAGNTLFFRNTAASGSTAPAYAPAVTNPFGITDVGRAASPTLTDIDDDGDLDLFIGNRAGNTLFFRNNAAPGSTTPAYAAAEPNPFGITDVGRFAKPSFTDTDNDGDLDLFIGNLRGNTLFFRNTAAAGSTAPAYAPAATNPFGINDVGLSAAPAFTDIDGDGDLDLFIGNRDGNTLVFRNNAPPGSTAPAYSQERGANGAPNPFGITDVGFNASPAFADPDNDSDPDLFIGNAAGDTIFFRNTGAAPGVNTSAINGIYTIGAVINLTIGFSKPVVVDTTGGTPTLQLETGNIDRKAVFISGSGTNTLSFQYTVQDGDTSADLDQLSSTALELNGGSITDANGNPAILSLPQPGTQGSLSDNADLIIDTNDLITSTIRSSESLTLPDGLANLILTGTANLNGTGNDLDNRIEGNSGKNRLNGKGGNDTLIGKEDKDKLTGGSDADTFLFQSINDSGITNATRDQITDFTADDTIDLSRIDADPNTNGDQAFVFIGSDRFSDIGQARFNNAVLRLNIDDDLFADFQINLKGVTDLPDNSLIL
ncbi:FG-GAP-like repeat-containing protein [Synechococcus sp. A10-1-5-9]|uniref:FG-GAP-like repeat-containing protein n=1 Tax=Synechococcus sp. A10-1-5-9 TaxID=3392295 RepID=UPI0039E87950